MSDDSDYDLALEDRLRHSSCASGPIARPRPRQCSCRSFRPLPAGTDYLSRRWRLRLRFAVVVGIIV